MSEKLSQRSVGFALIFAEFASQKLWGFLAGGLGQLLVRESRERYANPT